MCVLGWGNVMCGRGLKVLHITISWIFGKQLCVIALHIQMKEATFNIVRLTVSVPKSVNQIGTTVGRNNAIGSHGILLISAEWLSNED